jgi:hypothetical protein
MMPTNSCVWLFGCAMMRWRHLPRSPCVNNHPPQLSAQPSPDRPGGLLVKTASGRLGDDVWSAWWDSWADTQTAANTAVASLKLLSSIMPTLDGITFAHS